MPDVLYSKWIPPIMFGIAKKSRLRLALCAKHGLAAHHTNNGRCLQCFTVKNVPRGTDNNRSGRRAARRAGETHYTAYCGLHGAMLFDVLHGKCPGCFTPDGRLRKPTAPISAVSLAPPAKLSPPATREEARVRGKQFYMALCPTHGRKQHSTGTGACFSCARDKRMGGS